MELQNYDIDLSDEFDEEHEVKGDEEEAPNDQTSSTTVCILI